MPTADFHGRVACDVPPDAVVRALHDPNVMRHLVPGCSALVPTGPGDWTGQVERAAGPVKLRLAASLSVRETRPGAIRITVKGGSLLAGKVTLDALLLLAATPTGSQIEHSGTLAASGLAGGLLAGQEDRIGALAQTLIEGLARRIAPPPPQS